MPPVQELSERPVFIQTGCANGDVLFGIFHEPAETGQGIGVVVLAGGGTPVSTGVNQLSARLCRAMASQGFHALRFDYHGVGESTGVIDEFRLDLPFVDDLAAVIRWIGQQGISRVWLVGSCFGSRTALATAAQMENVERLALISLPVRDFKMGEGISTGFASRLTTSEYIRRALRPHVVRGFFTAKSRRSYVRIAKAKFTAIARGNKISAHGWVSARLLAEMGTVLKRGAEVLIIQGDGDDYHTEFEAALQYGLGDVIRSGSVRLVVTAGRVHGFPRLDAQASVFDLIMEWLATPALS